MIVQNISTEGTARTDISFTLPKTDGPGAVAAITRAHGKIGFKNVLYDDHIGKVSLVGPACAPIRGSLPRSSRRSAGRGEH